VSTLFRWNIIKLSIEWDITVFMDVLASKFGHQALDLAIECFFPCLCSFIVTRKGLRDFEIVIQTRDTGRGFSKLLENLLTPQVFS